MNGSREKTELIANERGLSLIEILMAVTMMSIISVTIMGYFVNAVERSADENRRIIAANLARLKTAEIREMAKKTDMAVPLSNYQVLLSGLSASTERKYTKDAQFPAPYHRLLDSQTINGTAYTFEATLDKLYRTELVSQMAGSADGYLLRLRVSVSWQDGAMSQTAANATTIDTYIIERG